MQCINDDCDSMKTMAVETYKTPAAVYRVRKCPKCGTRYTTNEVLARDQTIPEKIRQVKRRTA